MSGKMTYDDIIIPESRVRGEISGPVYTGTAKLPDYGQRGWRLSDIPFVFQELFSVPCIEDRASLHVLRFRGQALLAPGAV